MKFKIFVTAITLSFFMSCQKDNDQTTDNYLEKGSAMIINEGGFTKNNGSISFISRDNKVINNIFEQANGGRTVGDVLQSFTRIGNLGILCVNNSQKVVFVDVPSFKQIAEITTGTDYPRFAIAINDEKAYISNGSFSGQVLVVNLKNFTVTKTINVGGGPEEMLSSNGKVFVANSGGFGTDNTISVINTATDKEISRITVGDNPTEMERDAQGYLWVLCKGNVTYSPPTYMPVRHSAAKLVRINPALDGIDKEIEIVASNNNFSTADNLAISGDGSKIFVCVDDKVYQLPYSATSLPATPIITHLFYGLDVHPYTGEIWGLDAGNYNESGKIIRYNSSAVAVDTFRVGIIPNAVYFNL